ncbi:MAG TPA: 6-hydroxymethylpterin diphosphokinase MptE-like protein [Spirochaetia bacterium]|nr:6-hydroxymethylpterin diphosphokinase MptE-like protein [Spirochaetia bacterium]
MPDEQSAVLAGNLAALASSNPSLAALIAKSVPSAAFLFRRARDGSMVPSVRTRSGEIRLHSLIDPRKEAQRLLQSIGAPGYLACFGMGGGFSAEAFLRQRQAAGLLIIEKDASILRALLGNLDLSTVLKDQRTQLTVGTGEIRSIVRSRYLPAVCGDFSSLPLRPWFEAEEDFFGRAAHELSRAADEARADYAVQARFGKRWFANTILNLPAAQTASLARVHGQLAHVTAAGPSLEDDLEELAERDDGGIIVATDTSLPALQRFGVTPDVVVSIDCQLYTYHHFLMSGSPKVIQFFDLASPPFLVRRAETRARFFTSAHPLSRYAAARWRRFPVVDTTGGNVTHAAVSLARALGVSSVRVHGADFSYPGAKPYARGTYLYDFFQEHQQRCLPLESSLVTLVLGSAGLTRVPADSGVRFSTLTLLDYQERLKNLIEDISGSEADPIEESPAQISWQEFLAGYAESIRALPLPSSPLGGYFSGLPGEQRGLWATLLPITARILREAGGKADRAESLDAARLWALERVDRMLTDWPQEP